MNSSDNEAEFAGFTNEDIENTNDSYVPDSDPDSDITISSVHSSDITNFGESDGESGIDNDNAVVPDEWTCDFGEIEVEPFIQESGPVLPDDFDPTRWHPMDYLNLLFKPEMFTEIANHTNNYAIFKRDERQAQRNDPNYIDPQWQETSADELRALFGITILMGINVLPQVRMYWDHDEFTGNTGIKKTFPLRRYLKLMEYLHVSYRATEPG